MTIGNESELESLRRIGQLVARVLARMQAAAEPGMSTAELDRIGAGLLAATGARSAPQLVYGFPGATCISVNEEAAHGVPGERRLEPGDVVNVDVSAELDGYFADTGGSFVLPPASPRDERLCRYARLARARAIREVRAGRPINRIGKAIQQVARQARLQVIRNLTSHGVGRALHEEPTILLYYEPTDRRLFTEGMVITIEPFLSTQSREVRELEDGWTLVGEAGNRSAQYEHTLVVTRGEPIVLTRPPAH